MQIKKRYPYKTSILIISLIMMSMSVYSQEPANTSLIATFQQYQSDHYQEKVFIHTDKNFYLAGETIWMKAYVTDGFFHALSTLSKVVYIEILDKNQNPVLRTKMAVSDATGEASLIIPSTVLSGNYLLRGYTQWMKNFGPASYYEEPISIVNTLRESGKAVAAAKNTAYDVQFFPESGILLNGVNSVIAFKAIDQNESSVACKGYILNQRKDTIARFQSGKFGMGHFTVNPQSGERYTAYIQIGDSLLQRSLPQAQNQGYVVTLADKNDQEISITAHAMGNTPGENLSLFIHSGQLYKTLQSAPIVNGEAVFTCNKSSFADGISHITLFNSKGKPVCERLYFKKPQKKLAIQLSANKTLVGAREKMTISLNTQNELAQFVPSNLSMSVFLVDSLQSSELPTDILSYLLLSSELKGRIESPGYYFIDDPATNNERAMAADNLMLTQGWSRFRWEDMQAETQKPFEFLPEIEGPLIRGKITNKKTGAPADKIMAYLSVPGTHYKFATATSNAAGDISFNPGIYSESNEVIVQTNYEVDSIYRISITDPFSDQYSGNKVKTFALPFNTKNQLLNRSFAAQIENSYDKTLPIQLSADTAVFFGKPDNSYQLDAYTRFTSMEEVMREYVNEIRVKLRGNRFQFGIWNKKLQQVVQEEPLLLMDGVPVFNTNKMIAFDPLKIKQLDVLAQTNITGGLVSHGIVSYLSYHGDLANFPLDPNALVLEYEGMQKHKDFYMPEYSSPDQQRSRLPDMRNVLYWAPDILTDKTGKKELHFYTSDLSGKYAIVIQGISQNGVPGYASLIIETK